MKNFEEIIAKIARENGTTPENVLREMQLAIDHAYDHHCKNRHPSPICTRFEHHLAGGLAPLSRTEAPRPYNWFSTAKL